MHCTACGRQAGPADRHCGGCGAPVPQSSASTSAGDADAGNPSGGSAAADPAASTRSAYPPPSHPGTVPPPPPPARPPTSAYASTASGGQPKPQPLTPLAVFGAALGGVIGGLILQFEDLEVLAGFGPRILDEPQPEGVVRLALLVGLMAAGMVLFGGRRDPESILAVIGAAAGAAVAVALLMTPAGEVLREVRVGLAIHWLVVICLAGLGFALAGGLSIATRALLVPVAGFIGGVVLARFDDIWLGVWSGGQYVEMPWDMIIRFAIAGALWGAAEVVSDRLEGSKSPDPGTPPGPVTPY